MREYPDNWWIFVAPVFGVIFYTLTFWAVWSWLSDPCDASKSSAHGPPIALSDHRCGPWTW